MFLFMDLEIYLSNLIQGPILNKIMDPKKKNSNDFYIKS